MKRIIRVGTVLILPGALVASRRGIPRATRQKVFRISLPQGARKTKKIIPLAANAARVNMNLRDGTCPYWNQHSAPTLIPERFGSL